MSEKAPFKKRRIIWLVLAIIALGGAIGAYMLMEDTAQVQEKEDVKALQRISYIEAALGDHSGTLRTLAEIKSRWSTDINAHVGGEIVSVYDLARSGTYVQKGDPLFKIEDSTYKSQLAEVQEKLANAQLQLLQENKKAAQAKKDWQRSGLGKTREPSELALNKPQLALAEKAVEAAKAAVEAALKDVDYTLVTAPFNGILTERYVSIGQTISAGEKLAYMLDNTALDITVSLSARQWRNLAENWQEQEALAYGENDEVLAKAKIKRGGGFLDPETRLYKIFLEVENADQTNALSGEFASIALPGRVVENCLRVPESALSREGLIWYIDEQNRLRNFGSEALFYENDDTIIVSAPAAEKTYRIVIHPLASFIAGKEIEPFLSEGGQ